MLMSVEDAQSRILSRGQDPLECETVPLLESLARVLGTPVTCEEEIPGFANSSMDGFAVRAEDLASASEDSPVFLPVVGTIAAGHLASRPLGPGQAYKIMTGAPMPAGADAVIQVEWTRSAAPSQFAALAPVAAGQNVRHAGQDMHQGDRVLESGTVITPPLIGILATLGHEYVQVYRRPTVAIISTGDELVPPGMPLPPGHIRNSNSFALAAAVLACGAQARVLAPARDTKAEIAQRFEEGLSADIVLSSGGVSVGDFDWVKDVLQEQGTLDLWRVNMKPGKPLAYGQIQGRPFFGLPGNPVSALVTFELFVRPLIRTMLHDRRWARTVVELPLCRDFTTVQDRRHYVRCQLRQTAGLLSVCPDPRQDSAVQSAWIGAEALMIVPANTGPYREGDRLPVMLLS